MSEILDKLHEQGQTVYLSGKHGEAVKTIYLDGVYRHITPDMEAVCAYCDGLLQAERAEVRRLRAMLEPTPDARELAHAILLIAARDARLLDDAAERGIAWLVEQIGHIDPALAATNSGKWLIKLREKQTAELRAAIKGAAHE